MTSSTVSRARSYLLREPNWVDSRRLEIVVVEESGSGGLVVGTGAAVVGGRSVVCVVGGIVKVVIVVVVAAIVVVGVTVGTVGVGPEGEGLYECSLAITRAWL